MLYPVDFDKVNDLVIDETRKVLSALQVEQSRLGIKHTSNPSGLAIAAQYKKTAGMVSRIRFRFKRSMVFVHKGAGRGQGGNVGSQWRNKNGEVVKTNPKSLGKMDSGKRRAKEWFNPVIENFVEKLTGELATEFVEITFSNLKIKHSR